MFILAPLKAQEEKWCFGNWKNNIVVTGNRSQNLNSQIRRTSTLTSLTLTDWSAEAFFFTSSCKNKTDKWYDNVAVIHQIKKRTWGLTTVNCFTRPHLMLWRSHLHSSWIKEKFIALIHNFWGKKYVRSWLCNQLSC